MSIFHFSGSGELRHEGADATVAVSVDLRTVNGHTRVHCHALHAEDESQFLIIACSDKKKELTNVTIQTPLGEIKSEKFMTGGIAASIGFSSEELDVLKLVKQNYELSSQFQSFYFLPTKSEVEFTRSKLNPEVSGAQYIFIGTPKNMPKLGFTIRRMGVRVKIKAYNAAHPLFAGMIVYEASRLLTEKQLLVLNTSMELVIRQRLGFVSLLTCEVVKLNVHDHSTLSMGCITKPFNETAFLSVFDYVERQPHMMTFNRFLIESAADTRYVDDRTVNAFLALESMNENNSLTPEFIKQALSVDLSTAKILKSLRDEMFHNGLPISEALVKIHAKKPTAAEKEKRILETLNATAGISYKIYFLIFDALFDYLIKNLACKFELNRHATFSLSDENWYKLASQRER